MDGTDTSAREGLTPDLLERAVRAIVRSAAACASYCEHVEHNEPATTQQVVHAAEQLRETAVQLAAAAGVSLSDAYATRIREVESASLHQHGMPSGTSELAGADALDAARTWADFQLGQLAHDRQFHPDVFGLPKVEQLRHYTFHVTKLAGLLVDAIDAATWEDFCTERLADIAVFGVKLATVCNEKLPPTALEASAQSEGSSASGNPEAIA